jgi:hypothetical protein
LSFGDGVDFAASFAASCAGFVAEFWAEESAGVESDEFFDWSLN